MNKWIFEELLPTGGICVHGRKEGRKTSLSAAFPKTSATMSLVSQHPPLS